MKPAFFLDRDGTVCTEIGYVNHPSRLELLPRSAAAIRRARTAGFACVLVTNQAGVARGYFSEDRIPETHARLATLLAAEGTMLDGIYYCPHHPRAGEPPYRADCDCRKPRPGMIQKAARELGLDVAASFVVGDKISDVEMAKTLGATGILVRTGYGLGEEAYRQEFWPVRPDFIADDLLAAVEWGLAHRPARRLA
jgi:D-glycero-D-manno-heptose 1,7-bisphosphate phosphatase